MVAGGEGVRARGQEATESYPGRVGFGLGAAGRRLAGEQGEAAAVANGGDGLGLGMCRGGSPRPGEALWGLGLHEFSPEEGVHRAGLDGGVRGGGERRSRRAQSGKGKEQGRVSLWG